MPTTVDDFRKIVGAALGSRSKAGTATAAGLPRDAISSLLNGHEPKLSRAAEVCDALGLELYVGPPREPVDQPPIPLGELERSTRDLVRLTAGAGGDPIPDDLWPVLAVRHGGGAPAAANENLPGARPVIVVELAAAAGGGAETADEVVKGRVWFRRDWLDQRGIDPTQCAVIGVQGESMHPTLPDGCSILVDRQRTELLEEQIFVVRVDDHLVVKRAGLDEGGGWVLVSDHEAWPPVSWPADAEIIGQVVWMARALV